MYTSYSENNDNIMYIKLVSRLNDLRFVKLWILIHDT